MTSFDVLHRYFFTRSRMRNVSFGHRLHSCKKNRKLITRNTRHSQCDDFVHYRDIIIPWRMQLSIERRCLATSFSPFHIEMNYVAGMLRTTGRLRFTVRVQIAKTTQCSHRTNSNTVCIHDTPRPPVHSWIKLDDCTDDDFLEKNICENFQWKWVSLNSQVKIAFIVKQKAQAIKQLAGKMLRNQSVLLRKGTSPMLFIVQIPQLLHRSKLGPDLRICIRSYKLNCSFHEKLNEFINVPDFSHP